MIHLVHGVIVRITWAEHFTQCQNTECARSILVFVPCNPHKDLIKDALSHLTDVKTETPRGIQFAEVICPLLRGWAEEERDRENRAETPSGTKGGNVRSRQGRGGCCGECHCVVTAGGLRMTYPVHTSLFHCPWALILLILVLRVTQKQVWTPTKSLKELFIPKAWCLNIQSQMTFIVKENSALHVT